MEATRRHTAVGPWQRTALFPEPRPQSLREALRTLAAAIPDQIAIREGDRTLTYAELTRMTDAVAGAVSEAGGAPVTVIVGHGIDALLMVFGVIASGRIMVPLDAKDPIERLALVHREAGATVTVTDRAHVAVAEAAMPHGAIVVLEDTLTSMPTPSSLRDPDPYEIAVVLFTSGSTGTPKGVVRDHVALLRHAMSATYSNGIVPGDQIAFTGSFAFVGAYSRSLGALLGGATICVHDYRTDSLRSFPEWVVANRIAVIQMVPSVLRALTDAASGTGAPRMDCVRLITLSGETLYGRDVARARPLFGKDTVIRNRLGATESASIASWDVTLQDDLAADDPVPIGYVEPWTELHIVDDDGQEVPIGVAGLADVISDHASRGYWRDPELTAQKFWDLPDGRRGFHTSDRVRVRPDGVLEHVAAHRRPRQDPRRHGEPGRGRTRPRTARRRDARGGCACACPRRRHAPRRVRRPRGGRDAERVAAPTRPRGRHADDNGAQRDRPARCAAAKPARQGRPQQASVASGHRTPRVPRAGRA